MPNITLMELLTGLVLIGVVVAVIGGLIYLGYKLTTRDRKH